MSSRDRDPHAVPVLLCLPHAGGAATAFRPWQRLLKDVVRVVALEPPGRGARRAEALATTLPAVVDSVSEKALETTDGAERVALLGHSFGALVARGLADVLTDAGRAPVLFVSVGMNAPTLPSAAHPMAELSDDELLEAIVALGGVPDEIRDEPEMLALFVKPLRNDLGIAERAPRKRGDRRLDCPVLAIQGADDPFVSPHGVRAWREETTGPCSITWFPGGHFFVHDRKFIRETLRPLLERWLREGPRAVVS
jgi:surfactin synthase thioesterase subunit